MISRLKSLQPDIISGFTVFLIALPLSLGIAMASGVPPLAGLISAIVGGIGMAILGGGHVGINGPAAGLIVVVINAVDTLGRGDLMAGYRGLLATTVIAGGLLVFMGKVLKVGRLGEIFPSATVQGMLAAIGAIIISKQVHVALGVAPIAPTPLALFAEIPRSIAHMNPEIATIGILSLVVLIGLPLLPWSWIKFVPVPMVVVLIGILLSHVFDLDNQHKFLFLPEHGYDLGPQFLVSLPKNIFSGIVFPDFSAVLKPGFIGVLLTLAIVQGLETLLSASAVDKFDPKRRLTNLNKDIAAVGICSAIAGFLGGLPIITEIVRSRANVSNGAQTKASNFFHGAFLFAFVALAPGLMHQIPLASLAAILIVTGYRLASPSQFKYRLEIGFDQLVIFSATLLSTLATDLLVGVATGVILNLLIHVARGTPLKSFFKPDLEVQIEDEDIILFVRKEATFTNYLAIKAELMKLPLGRNLTIDVCEIQFIDHTVMEKLNEFIENYNHSGGRASFLGLEDLKSASQHPLAARIRL